MAPDDHPQPTALENVVAYERYLSTGDRQLRVDTLDAEAKQVKSVPTGHVNGADNVRDEFNIMGLSKGAFVVTWGGDAATSASFVGIRV